MITLGSKKLSTHRHHPAQCLGHIDLGRAHHIQMILASVRDHSMSRSHELILAEPLQVRNQRHALNHQRFGFHFSGRVNDPQLLDHVGA